MSKLYFVTFADSTLKASIKRIKKQVKKFGVFDKCFFFTEKDLPQKIQQDLKTIIEKTGSKRGYGFMSWKPLVINTIMDKMNDGDVLLYSDVGCHINPNGKTKFFEYVGKAKEHDIWVTQLEIKNQEKCYISPQSVMYGTLPETEWTKADTIKLFEGKIPEKEFKNGQLQSTNLLLVKNAYTKSIIDQWQKLMTIENLHYFDDSPSILPNYPNFKENRHDQSMLSLLLKSNHYYGESMEHFYATDDGWQKLIDAGEPLLHKRDKVTPEKLKAQRKEKINHYKMILTHPRYIAGWIKRKIFQ